MGYITCYSDYCILILKKCELYIALARFDDLPMLNGSSMADFPLQTVKVLQNWLFSHQGPWNSWVRGSKFRFLKN